ncbi:MAG: FKBP-type peptidyl-prolyl cis-trans isomerase [Magnetococcales bacterium]|nr:FKBP-type peptidyl-prolyl cis-trans isomerase [Magnetococcales bacterium]
MGLQFGVALKGALFKVDTQIVDRAIKDVLSGDQLLLDAEQRVAIRDKMVKQVRAEQAALVSAAAKQNREEGEAFLKKNRKEKGVRTTSSGLQYKILKKGSGPRPTLMDTVTVNYRGTLLNGQEFDSSYKRNKPTTFPLNGVIKGWTEGVQLMNVGSKYELFIPSKLAYGSRGAGKVIGPDATLVFEVELLSIK